MSNGMRANAIFCWVFFYSQDLSRMEQIDLPCTVEIRCKVGEGGLEAARAGRCWATVLALGDSTAANF